ncbi:MAG: hypothetical protein KJ874_08310, partial [Acidobacteria bacterium]|nr:hypothetical protein [Acidobacteriota bacterium]
KAPFGFHLLGETFYVFACLYYTDSSGVVEAYILLSLMIIAAYPIIRANSKRLHLKPESFKLKKICRFVLSSLIQII